MFIETRREHSFWGWASQLALSYLGTFLGLLLFSALTNFPDSPFFQGLNYFVMMFAGAGLAGVVSRSFPQAAKEGSWVWVIPVLIWAAVATGILLGSISGTLGDLFCFDPKPGAGEGGWVVLMLTLPTCSCCCYSAVMARRSSAFRSISPTD